MHDLKLALQGAIEKYKAKYPQRAKSAHRSKNIQDITEIINKHDNENDLLNALEDYFSNDYYTGLLDRSALEDFIVDAIAAVNKELQLALNTFGYFPENQTPMDKTPNGADDKFIDLEYTLEDFIDYALDSYVGEKRGEVPLYRQEDIKQIKAILSERSADRARLIKTYIDEKLTHSFNSALKNKIHQALKHFNHHASSRKVASRIWEPTVTSKHEKIMIFLHGWLGSVNSGDLLAVQAVNKGFRFIAYDHRHHGKDAERNKGGISPDLLRIDFRLFLKRMKSLYPDAQFALAGHSLGGAILTSEYELINNDPAIKSVSLIAPAVSNSLANLLSPSKIFARNMHTEVQMAEQSTKRHGGNGIFSTFIGLINFMFKVGRYLLRLFSKASEKSDQSQWNIYSGKRDFAVNCAEFKSLSTRKNRGVTFFPRADHVPHYGRHHGSYIRTILNDVTPCFTLNEVTPSLVSLKT